MSCRLSVNLVVDEDGLVRVEKPELLTGAKIRLPLDYNEDEGAFSVLTVLAGSCVDDEPATEL